MPFPSRKLLCFINLSKYNYKILPIINAAILTRSLTTTTKPITNHSSTTKTNNNQNDSRGTFSIGQLTLILTTGFLTYKLLQQSKHLLPSVSAAVPSNLKGRRQQFNFIADVVDSSASSVVYIEIKDTRKFEFFSGKPLTLSNGSGFIIHSDGLILTNAHVVINKSNSKVEVKLFDGKIYTGIVEDIDTISDLATVRINAKDLPTIPLGSSKDLRPGEWVVAIGSPLSLSNTVTCGVVSSAHRGSQELGLRDRDMVYIQTDAAITFGNSGGPLVNLDGEAIGVNSMKVTAGISFAIPIDYVKDFLRKSKGERARPTSGAKRKYMGITMLTLTPQILHDMQQRGHSIPPNIQKGVLVWKVIYGSPAHSGGLQPGDIVIEVNGKPVFGANDIYAVLQESDVNNMKMSVVRFGKTLQVMIQPEDVE